MRGLFGDVGLVPWGGPWLPHRQAGHREERAVRGLPLKAILGPFRVHEAPSGQEIVECPTFAAAH